LKEEVLERTHDLEDHVKRMSSEIEEAIATIFEKEMLLMQKLEILKR